MKLTRVHIKNFRCFESLDVPLQPDVNVFVGVNGAGKSALLDAIVELAYPIALGLGKINPKRGTTKADRKLTVNDIAGFPSKQLTRRGHRVELSAMAMIGDSKKPYKWSPKYTRKGSSLALNELDSLPIQHIRELIESQNPLFYPMFSYYGANRGSEKQHSRNITNISSGNSNPYEKCLDIKIDYNATLNWFYMRENSELRQKVQIQNDPSFEFADLKAIRKALAKSIEGVQKIFFENEPPSLMVEIKKGSEGIARKFTLDQISDGYRSLLGIIMDFARRMAQANPEADNPLEAPGILLIDEIELHLHPRWQQIIIPRLREIFPNTQIIAATHSPQVLTTVESRCIHILRDQKIYAAPPGSYGAESKRMLERVLGTDSRPPDNEFVKELKCLFDLIEREKYEDAKTKLHILLGQIGEEEPALVRAQTRIENRLWEKKMGI